MHNRNKNRLLRIALQLFVGNLLRACYKAIIVSIHLVYRGAMVIIEKMRKTNEQMNRLLLHTLTNLTPMLHFLIQKPFSSNQLDGFYMKCNTGLKWVNPLMVSINRLITNVPHDIATSQLICNANQLTGFYDGKHCSLIG